MFPCAYLKDELETLLLPPLNGGREGTDINVSGEVLREKFFIRLLSSAFAWSPLSLIPKELYSSFGEASSLVKCASPRGRNQICELLLTESLTGEDR